MGISIVCEGECEVDGRWRAAATDPSDPGHAVLADDRRGFLLVRAKEEQQSQQTCTRYEVMQKGTAIDAPICGIEFVGYPYRSLAFALHSSRRVLMAPIGNVSKPGESATVYFVGEHGGTVTALAASPCMTRLASADSLGEVKVWGLEDGCLRSAVQYGHDGGVSCLAFARRHALVTGGSDGYVRAWEECDDKRLKANMAARTHTPVTCLAATPGVPHQSHSSDERGAPTNHDTRLDVYRQLEDKSDIFDGLERLAAGTRDGIVYVWRPTAPGTTSAGLRREALRAYDEGAWIECLSFDSAASSLAVAVSPSSDSKKEHYVRVLSGGEWETIGWQSFPSRVLIMRHLEPAQRSPMHYLLAVLSEGQPKLLESGRLRSERYRRSPFENQRESSPKAAEPASTSAVNGGEVQTTLPKGRTNPSLPTLYQLRGMEKPLVSEEEVLQYLSQTEGGEAACKREAWSSAEEGVLRSPVRESEGSKQPCGVHDVGPSATANVESSPRQSMPGVDGTALEEVHRADEGGQDQSLPLERSPEMLPQPFGRGDEGVQAASERDRTVPSLETEEEERSGLPAEGLPSEQPRTEHLHRVIVAEPRDGDEVHVVTGQWGEAEVKKRGEAAKRRQETKRAEKRLRDKAMEKRRAQRAREEEAARAAASIEPHPLSRPTVQTSAPLDEELNEARCRSKEALMEANRLREESAHVDETSTVPEGYTNLVSLSEAELVPTQEKRRVKKQLGASWRESRRWEPSAKLVWDPAKRQQQFCTSSPFRVGREDVPRGGF